MANLHPSDIDLVEYASGNSDWAIGIAISVHLHFCAECSARVSELNHLGACHIEKVEPAALANDSFAKTLKRISEFENVQIGGGQSVNLQQDHKPQTALATMPKVLQKIIGDTRNLKWSRLSPSLKAARLTTGQSTYEVCLHKISKGGKVAEHDHRGLEVTVVIDGSFSDKNGTYKEGDYIVQNPGDKHRPTATLDKECVCLSIVQAPVKLTGWLGRIINPFLSIRPA